MVAVGYVTSDYPPAYVRNVAQAAAAVMVALSEWAEAVARAFPVTVPVPVVRHSPREERGATPWLDRHPAELFGWVVPRQIGQENTAGFRPRPHWHRYRGKR